MLTCHKHGSPIYLQLRPIYRGSTTKTMCAVHLDGTRCSPPATGMSDAHKRQTEYIVRAAEDAGHRTEVEARLRSSRPDAVLYGPSEAIGVEVQRAQISRSSARSRTDKAMKSGLKTSVWFNDRENLPAWFFHVPSIGMNRLPWDVILPARRSATVTTGLRKIRAVRCGSAEVPLCPDRRAQRSTSCNNYHATHEPWLGMTVDDVAAMTPVGQMVPLSYKRKDVLLVEPTSRDLYEQLVGPLSSTQQAKPDRIIRTEDRVECMAPADLLESDHDDSLAHVYTGQHACCGQHYPGRAGESLALSCQLCPKSPTYYRLPRTGSGPE